MRIYSSLDADLWRCERDTCIETYPTYRQLSCNAGNRFGSSRYLSGELTDLKIWGEPRDVQCLLNYLSISISFINIVQIILLAIIR